MTLYVVFKNQTLESCFFKKYFFIYLAAPGLNRRIFDLRSACGVFSCSMWDLSFLSRNQTQAPCIGSTES